jgi:hypothetical protein
VVLQCGLLLEDKEEQPAKLEDCLQLQRVADSELNSCA